MTRKLIVLELGPNIFFLLCTEENFLIWGLYKTKKMVACRLALKCSQTVKLVIEVCILLCLSDKDMAPTGQRPLLNSILWELQLADPTIAHVMYAVKGHLDLLFEEHEMISYFKRSLSYYGIQTWFRAGLLSLKIAKLSH